MTPHEPIEHVWFPTSGVLSLISDANDEGVEVATVGNEGFVGVPVLLGAHETNLHCFCRVEALALRLRAKRFRAVIAEQPSLRDVAARYTQALFTQIAQHAARNASTRSTSAAAAGCC